MSITERTQGDPPVEINDLKCTKEECPKGEARNLGSSGEEALLRLTRFFVWDCIGGHVLGKLAAAFGTLALDNSHTAGGHGAGFEADDPALAHLYLGAEPVGAIHPPCGIERHRSRDRAFKFLSRARQNSLVRALLGSVSAKVAAEAPCTVTVVRPPRAASLHAQQNANERPDEVKV